MIPEIVQQHTCPLTKTSKNLYLNLGLNRERRGRGVVPGVSTSSIRMISPVSVSPNSNLVSAIIIPLVSAYSDA